MNQSFRVCLLASTAVIFAGLGSATSNAATVAGVEEVKGAIDSVERSKADPFAKGEEKKFGVVAGEWVILPELTVGTLYNDNVYASRTNTKGSWGGVIRPGVNLKRTTGIHNTTISLVGEANALPNVKGADTFSGAANLTHAYEIDRGLNIIYQGGVSRSQDQVSAVSATGAGGGANSVFVEPVSYVTYSSSLAVNKNFSQAFVSAGADVSDALYDNARTTSGATLSQSSRDLLQYSTHARAGFRFLSDGYAFVEPKVTQYDFGTGVPATGYTVIGGVGTDRLSLFRGEVFGGYQVVNRGSGAIGNRDLSGVTFGGRVSWTPTRDLIASVTADQSITPSTVLSGSVGTLTKSDTVTAVATYNYSTKIDLSTNAAYSAVKYSGSARNDKISRFGFNSTYYLTDSVGVRFEYNFSKINSNQPVFDYNKNVAILGLHMRI